jgi:putative sugar O-methyltransferase
MIHRYFAGIRDAIAHNRETMAEADALRSAGRLPEAAAHFRRIIEKDPGNTVAATAIASLFHALGEVPKAIDAYRNLLVLHPTEETLIRLSVLVAASEGEIAGIRLLDDWARARGSSAKIRAQLGRLMAISRRRNQADASNENACLRERLSAMDEEIASDEIYMPSLFWQRHIAMHKYLLETYGVSNFKRTVSHNYQNWLMTSTTDPQVSRLAAITGTDFEEISDPVSPADDLGFHFIIHPDQHPSNHPLFNLIEEGPHRGTVLYPFYPLADPRAAAIYGQSVRALWRHTCSQHPGPMSWLGENEIGNPVAVYEGGRLISSDIAHSVREQMELFNRSGLRGDECAVVAELGAGHGRLAELFGRTTNYRYFIFDITPALYVSEWYITRLFPRERIFKFRHFDVYDDIAAELDESRFAFFTPNQLVLLPDRYVNVFININSLMEMLPSQIYHFLREISRISSGYFFCKQWIDWTNGIDDIRTTQSDFNLGKGWQQISVQNDEIYQDFFTSVWRRGD